MRQHTFIRFACCIVWRGMSTCLSTQYIIYRQWTSNYFLAFSLLDGTTWTIKRNYGLREQDPLNELPFRNVYVWRHHGLSCVSPTYLISLSRVRETCYKCYPSLTNCKTMLFFFNPYNQQLPVPVATRSRACVCGPSLAGIVGSNLTGGMDVCLLWCVLSGRSLCVGLITRPEEFYRLWCVWVWSWIVDNEEVLDHWGLLCHGYKNITSNQWHYVRANILGGSDTSDTTESWNDVW
jgi:hypothetical protein